MANVIRRLFITLLPLIYMGMIWLQSSYPIQTIKQFLGVLK
ncbi:hypothetical protein HBHAL_4387 [Halobacillus halophilus DSM 2266]|uniref:Uncharacterized protein n=1 Tax=Halobacillus halophilus (strain ATCC 35676 / DSM 2266 / JCM 20832 / KCTC 3685 / LMG 17431 / NBRC 102448 / NCIMB 2269) TaxID=866895 RepID=I0JRF7_HALH3|nr:hypothetical protein HBHAL_4387 [Halobacillus halophilus DSM 2266]